MLITVHLRDGVRADARLERRPQGTYALDLRKFGAGRPTLKPAGSRAGTKSEAEARALAVDALRRVAGEGPVPARPIAGPDGRPLEPIGEYLDRRVRDGRMRPDTAVEAALCLTRCWNVLHAVGLRGWGQFQRPHVQGLVDGLFRIQHRGRPLSRNSVLKHINHLKGFVRYAVDAGLMPESPVHRHTAVPAPDRTFERAWLEPWEMGLLLEASFALRPTYRPNGCLAWPEILATECYTGARESEILGLARSELVLGKGGTRGFGTLRFQDNAWRPLKNRASTRTFSLWEPHAVLLEAYLRRTRLSPHGLLFPTPRDAMWRDLRESMHRDLAAGGITKPITDHSMRHSYISARARMYTRVERQGHGLLLPVHPKDIALEVGHGSDLMIRHVYDHDAPHPVEGWTELDYALALSDHRAAARVAGSAPKRARQAVREAEVGVGIGDSSTGPAAHKTCRGPQNSSRSRRNR